jgi:hypothetical protein
MSERNGGWNALLSRGGILFLLAGGLLALSLLLLIPPPREARAACNASGVIITEVTADVDGPVAVCVSENATYTLTTSADYPNATYSITAADGTPASVSGKTLTTRWTEPGTYKVAGRVNVTGEDLTPDTIEDCSASDEMTVTVLSVASLVPDNIEREVDDGDGNPDTRTFVVDVSATAGALVIVTATPSPSLTEDRLPGCWTLDGGTGNGKLQRTIDRTMASKTVLVCQCGSSARTTTVFVVSCLWSALADDTDMIGHAWWHFDIEPDSAIDEVIGRINRDLVDYVDTDAGFYPLQTGDPSGPGNVRLGPQTIGGTPDVHPVTARHNWGIGQGFRFANLMSGLSESRAFRLQPGEYHLFARNCVYGVCRIGHACPVANPAMHEFSRPGFNDPGNLADWLVEILVP